MSTDETRDDTIQFRAPRPLSGPGLAALIEATPAAALGGWDLTRQLPAPGPRALARCRCPSCKYGRAPGTDAVLYARPDAVWLLERAAIRDGRYEDSEAFGARVHYRVLADFDAAAERCRAKLGRAWEQITQMRAAA